MSHHHYITLLVKYMKKVKIKGKFQICALNLFKRSV